MDAEAAKIKVWGGDGWQEVIPLAVSSLGTSCGE